MPQSPCLCLPDCWMTNAAFFTSSWDRPSVTTTSTFGTFFLMPLSQVKTFSLMNVRALPAEWGVSALVSPRWELALTMPRWQGNDYQNQMGAGFHHPASPGKRRPAPVMLHGTCSCVSSSVPNVLEGSKGHSLIVVCVQLELGLDLITVLHKGNLKGNTFRDKCHLFSLTSVFR